jgi:GMP synthase-like glutamine amidotransferase
MSAVLAVIHHLQRPFLGRAARALREADLQVREHDLRRGDPLPDLDEVDGILSLGGEQSVLAGGRWLEDEAELLRTAVAREVPVLGICLGAQILAHATGGSVRREGRRIEWRELRRTPDAQDDPLARAVPDPLWALHWNEDVFTPPPGAVELWDRPAGPSEGFRIGPRAWGVQFHPDVDPDELEHWYELPGWLEEAGVEEAAARAADAERLPHQARSSEALFAAFAAVVGQRVTA